MKTIFGAAVAFTAIIVGSWLVVPDAMADSPAAPVAETQVTIKRLGLGLSQITLQPDAVRRLDIQVGEIRKDGSGKDVAPYASIMYDLDGRTWVYAVSPPSTYTRREVTIDFIRGGDAYFKAGPPAGTAVVTVGVSELYGTEVGVNGE